MTLDLTFENADALIPGLGLVQHNVNLNDGRISTVAGRRVDLRGYLVLPGIIDLHGDGFERHLAPRRGAMKQMEEGVVATEAELAANGITTAVMAQFWSWEGGVRGPDYAAQVFQAIRAARADLVTDILTQLRFETHMLDDYTALPARVAEWGVAYVVFNDHLPHDRLAQGRTPPRLTGQALKARRNPEAHLALLHQLHRNGPKVPEALDRLCKTLRAQGITLGSHDDQTAKDRASWRARGVHIAEFPETLDAAEAARAGGDKIILGAPNAVRGGSHKGNVSALDLIAMGRCDAIASDYHYPSPRRAALMLAENGMLDFERAWSLVSSGPADVLGLTDRGTLAPGQRADIVVLDQKTKRVSLTMSGGRISYMNGAIADRFLG